MNIIQRSIFFIIWTSTCLLSLELLSVSQFIFKSLFNYLSQPLILVPLSIITVIGLVFFVILHYKILRKLFIHKFFTQFFLIYLGLYLAFAINLSAHIPIDKPEFKALIFLFFLSPNILIYLYVQSTQSFVQNHNILRFASGSKSLKDDSFGFSGSAKSSATSIATSNTKEHVSVISLYGEMGSGKSSFTRMIIESLDKLKEKEKNYEFLYSYISLTETNEAKSFSKLFVQRWLDTLSERYVFFRSLPIQPFLEIIFKEKSWNQFINPIKFLFNYLLSFQKTKAKAYDPDLSIEPLPKDCSTEISSIFANLPEIKENFWIIVIDEIERAQLDEIYRLVEVIERFKNEGRSGLPIRLIFLLCISREDLKKVLGSTESDKKVLLESFFFEDAKTVTQTLFVPGINVEVKEKFLIDRIKDILGDGIEKLELNEFYIDECHAVSNADPTQNFIEDPKEAFNYVLSELIQNTPRVINRCLNEFNSFLKSYKSNTGEDPLDVFFIGDILLLSLVRVHYPFLIVFFDSTVEEQINFKNRFYDLYYKKENYGTRHTLSQIKERNPNLKIDSRQEKQIQSWAHFLGMSWSEKEEGYYHSAPKHFSYLKLQRTSAPELMFKILRTDQKKKSYFSDFINSYQNPKDSRFDISLYETNELGGFSQFLRFCELNYDFEKVLELLSKALSQYPLDKLTADDIGSRIIIADELVELIKYSVNLNIDLANLTKFISKLLNKESLVAEIKICLAKLLWKDPPVNSTELRNQIKSIIKNTLNNVREECFQNPIDTYKNNPSFLFLIKNIINPNDIEDQNKVRSIFNKVLNQSPEIINYTWEQYPAEPLIEQYNIKDKNNFLLDLDILIKFTDKNKLSKKAYKNYSKWNYFFGNTKNPNRSHSLKKLEDKINSSNCTNFHRTFFTIQQ